MTRCLLKSAFDHDLNSCAREVLRQENAIVVLIKAENIAGLNGSQKKTFNRMSRGRSMAGKIFAAIRKITKDE